MKIPVRAIGRSLLFDLLIPWTVSAALIVLIGLMILSFGLIAWPIAFVLFIFYAKQHQLARDARLNPPPRHVLASDEGLSAEEFMQRYDIRHTGRYYSVAGMDFDRLADAISYGRMQARDKA